MLDGALADSNAMKIEMEGSPDLIVPLEQVDSIERPPFYTGSPR